MLRLNHNKAIEAFSNCIALKDKITTNGKEYIVESYLELSDLYYEMNQLDNAQRYLNKLTENYPELVKENSKFSRKSKQLKKQINERKEWNKFFKPHLIN